MFKLKIMKVDIEKITLGHSPITDSVFAGISKNNPHGKGMMWQHKKDVTNEFIGCVIQRWENKKETIQSGDDKWEITVKKLKK